MNFYKVAKYVIAGIFILIMVVAVVNSDNKPESAVSTQPVGQSKFNF